MPTRTYPYSSNSPQYRVDQIIIISNTEANVSTFYVQNPKTLYSIRPPDDPK